MSHKGGSTGDTQPKGWGYLSQQSAQRRAECRGARIAALFDTLQHGHVVPRWWHWKLGRGKEQV